MSMPPSGVEGLMDEQALIEAEIQLELENINLDDEVPVYDDQDVDNEMHLAIEEQEDVGVADELDDYIKRLQDQSSRFEQELLECDELLSHSTHKNESVGTAIIPYEDQTLLMQLAKEQGCDVEEYRRKILEDIENDEDILEDEVADLIGDTGLGRDGEQCSSIENQGPALMAGLDAGLPVKIEKAIEEGMAPEEVPVSQDLVLVNGEGDGPPNMRRDIQNMLREQLESLENRYQERINKIKKDEAYRRDEEEVREKRMNEERQWKLQEIQRQEQQLIVEREMAESDMQREQELAEKEMQENMKKFQEEMAHLQADMDRQKKEHENMVEMERKKQEENQQKSVLIIQRTYRGYRVRKETQPVLNERKEIRKKWKEEERIKEVEIEIERRKGEQQQQEEIERQKQEDDKREKEELKRQKEEEKKRLEEEKRRKKEEEERLKQEEKRRKEEEKQRKKEEEKRRKEEEKMRKEEEEQRKKEEKRLKEEEEKRRKEEEKRKKEEEKRRKEEEKKRIEEEKRLKEEEKKREKERQIEEERKKKEEIVLNDEMKHREAETDNNELKENDINSVHAKDTNDTPVAENINTKDGRIQDDASGNIVAEHNSAENVAVENSTEKTSIKTEKKNSDSTDKRKETNEDVTDNSKEGAKGMVNGSRDGSDHSKTTKIGTHRPKTPRSARTPRAARPPTPRKDKAGKEFEEKELKEEKTEIKVDILPDHLESLRLKFMKECLPWSKVSNEPWKLKAGVSKKPLRRPSSAKKLPLLSEDVVIQAARVASLKMVTTVELKDLPGNNISPLGQCGGLKFLTLNNCNLMAVEGLSQCKQLQYINVQGNKIEYVDLKDVGQLQYLNLSHNKLSSIHGLDNCTNLRWLDVSYNNVTRLGGMDTLRRLHSLKISHNQLISTQGLSATPTLQMLDVSHNHLQAVEELDKLCLLFSLNACSNNLLQVPSLHNQVLLLELLLSDNSISSLSVLAAVWLPLLSTVHLQQNSLSELPSLQNCLLLKELNLSDNQISDLSGLQHCIEGCFYLEQLHLMDNPVYTDLTESFFSKVKCSCPRLNCSPDFNADTTVKLTPVKPRNSYETMCFTQTRAMKDVIGHFEQNLKLSKGGTADQSQVCDIHYKFCDRTFNIAVDHRYAHEYGDISVAMPTAPTGPKSGRPLSSRQKEKFLNPKEMFENALKSTNNEPNSVDISNDKVASSDPKDLFANALKAQTSDNKGSVEVNHVRNEVVLDYNVNNMQSNYTANPRDLFEQALKSADKPSSGTGMDTANYTMVNGQASNAQQDRNAPNKMSKESQRSLAATTIQRVWRGYMCRKDLLEQLQAESMMRVDPSVLQKMHKSAVVIQAYWKGYILRKKLLAALEYAQCNFDDDEDDDDDMIDFGDEFDLDKFVDIDQDLLDTDWKPPDTPDIPSNYAVLKKPPSGKPKVPPINTADTRPPSNPRRAWRNMESPLSDMVMGKIPRPPSSVASTELTMRSGVSRKEEKMAEEWGFKDTGTAHLMMQRAKKMKYNAERRKKISKLDPKQRLALFRKLEEVIHPPTHTVPQRKTLPRKEYFQARQDEIVRQDQEKRQEYHNRASRTFEWLHTQVGDHVVSDSVINPGQSDGPKYVPVTENLPELLNGGKRVQLVSSPMSVELQSVESSSTVGPMSRRFSAGSGSGSSKLPPIQPSSAPVGAPHLKERMSFRNPKVNQSVGWGGGKKRGKQF